MDEAGSRTDLTRLFGRAEPGARVVEAVPAGHYEQLTLVGSLRLDGSVACMTLEGAIDGDSFLAYVEQVLCPTLGEGDLVVLDNLSSTGTDGAADAGAGPERAARSAAAPGGSGPAATPHTGAKVAKAIAQRKARLLFLPPYSPDLNPIEKMWSKVKQFLRQAKARTKEALELAIKQALAAITVADAQGWFESCGYGHIHS